MAGIAGTVGRNMVGWFRQPRAACLVTVGTGVTADDHRWRVFRVVDGTRCPRGGGLVTTITLRRRIAPLVAGGPRLGVFADIAAAMTGRALAGEASMVHGHHQEGGGTGVAGITLPVVRDVRAILAFGRRAVVASGTLTYRIGVMDILGRLPGCGAVAAITLARRIAALVGCTIPCFCIGGRIGATVTGGANSGRARVVHDGGLEGGKVGMAGVTSTGGGNVIAWFWQSCPPRLVAVGTGVITDDYRWRVLRVIHRGSRPSRG